MKILCFNVNGVRARIHLLPKLLEHFQVDIIGLQETKVSDAEFPKEPFDAMGYHLIYHGQKGHYGVALFSKMEPSNVQYGFPTDEDDAQRRMIAATYTTPKGHQLQVVNAYFPQGENRDHPVKFPNKAKFYADMTQYLQENATEYSILMGDLNISENDKDIGIGEANAKRWLKTGKASFLPEEREWLSKIVALGYEDTYRIHHPESNDQFSWFDYRSRGFEREPKRGLRIDQILASKPLAQTCSDAGIDYHFRAETKPSDHCALWADFDI